MSFSRKTKCFIQQWTKLRNRASLILIFSVLADFYSCEAIPCVRSSAWSRSRSETTRLVRTRRRGLRSAAWGSFEICSVVVVPSALPPCPRAVALFLAVFPVRCALPRAGPGRRAGRAEEARRARPVSGRHGAEPRGAARGREGSLNMAARVTGLPPSPPRPYAPF